MTLTVNRQTVTVVVVALALGWWLGSSPRSPVNPHPVPDRPILSAVARLTRTAARLGLWFAMAADPPPAAKAPQEREEPQQLVRATEIGADGHPRVDHARGW